MPDGFDNMLYHEAEQAALPVCKPDQRCELCDGLFYSLEACAGCGEVCGCKSCMIQDPNSLDWYCSAECMDDRLENQNDS